MKVHTVNIHYRIDGEISVIPTYLFYEQTAEDEFYSIYFEVKADQHHIQSKRSDSFEYAVKFLQKELPDNIGIACCQSCRYGHFNPFGDMENEIFCMKDRTPRSREDVVEIFSASDSSLPLRSRPLLYICNDYQPISKDELYTYNDWED